MNEKVQKALQSILERFKSGDIPEAIAFSLFPIQEIPSAKWSLMNRLLMFMAHTRDARGIRQWNRIGRKVKKGSKAIYILVPLLVQERDEKTGEEVRILRGFMGRPVFRVEDTEGGPLEYGGDAPLPEFPLMERAREWNIQVSGYDGPPGFYGVYSPERKEISLATPEEKVFFHELAHAAHEKVIGKLKSGQLWTQEIVAELSAQALCILVGKRSNTTLGNSFQYIDRYAKAAGLSAIAACLRVIDEAEKVLSVILGKDQGNEEKADRKSKDGRDENGKADLER